MLEEFGYTVIEASDGQEAVSKFMENKDRIDLFLSDIVMPGMNGREAYERIKKNKAKAKSTLCKRLSVRLHAQKRDTKRRLGFYIKTLFPLITF